MTQEKDNTTEFVHSFQRGEEKGFTHFFNTLYPIMLYYAFRITKDKAIAKEIVENAFIGIWEKHSTFGHPKQIKAWLYATIRTAGIDWLRRQETTQHPVPQIALTEENEYELKAMQELIRAEITREIYKAITNLPPRCRQVFKLIYIQGKTLNQVAEEMELSIHTIKNHRARGLNLLKKRIPTLISG